MKRLAVIIGICAMPLAAYADGFDYTFVDFGVVNTNLDVGPLDIDGDGLGIKGSYQIKDNLFVIGGYSEQDYDFGIDGNVLNVGVGLSSELGTNLDFVADLSYVDAEVATGFGSADEDGYGIGAGIRARAAEKVEIDAGLTYVDLNDSDTSLNVGARYYFSDSFAVGGGLTDTDNGLSWNVGVRAEFGRR